jgi:hypothetical protein
MGPVAGPQGLPAGHLLPVSLSYSHPLPTYTSSTHSKQSTMGKTLKECYGDNYHQPSFIEDSLPRVLSPSIKKQVGQVALGQASPDRLPGQAACRTVPPAQACLGQTPSTGPPRIGTPGQALQENTSGEPPPGQAAPPPRTGSIIQASQDRLA